MSSKEDVYNEQEIVNFYEITTNTENVTIDGLDCWRYEFDPRYGKGYYLTYHFEGLYVSVFEANFNTNIQMQGEVNERLFDMSCLLSGEVLVNLDGIGSSIAYEAQEYYVLDYLPKTFVSCKYYKDQPIKEVRFSMDDRFIKKHKIETAVNRFVANDDVSFIFQICAERQNLITEILEDRQEGVVKRLLLEAQCLKLISLQLEAISVSKNRSRSNGILKKLVEVQYIIKEDLSRHYSLLELSRMIGVNDFVLKREFKKWFGKTVFEYATELKMEKAAQLLKHGKQPIYEISDTIGYKNPTHFAAAFKKNIGYTPRQYRKMV